MDPVSQGALGASWAQSVARPRQLVAGAIIGCIAGMAPDADVLIRSSNDPLLFLEYHRHFTHALAFVPIGASVCALLLHPLTKRYLSFRQTLLFALLGYASHGLLDACTTYGTLLLWPFSDLRVAWNNVSVFDPLFTVPVIALVLLAARRRRRALALAAIAWAVTYLGLGALQTQRALASARTLALSRGHEPTRVAAMPAIASIVLWRTAYEHDGRYYVDAIREGLSTEIFPGESIEKLDRTRHLPWLDPDTQQAADIERFRYFTSDFLGVDPRQPNRIVDLRYSMLPNETDGIWAIVLNENAPDEAHVRFVTNRTVEEGRATRLFEMLF